MSKQTMFGTIAVGAVIAAGLVGLFAYLRNHAGDGRFLEFDLINDDPIGI